MQEFFIIYDSAVKDFAKKVTDSYHESEQSLVIGTFELSVSEQTKNIQTVEAICRALLEKGADRSVRLIAVGGGITTDIVGFVAAIYKRGVSFDSFPTTLVAQVDAVIGGKNGVNLDGYKNAIGTFLEPEHVYISSDPLLTLSPVQILSGAAEILKTFILGDKTLYPRAVELFTRLNQAHYAPEAIEENLNALEALVHACDRIKNRVVKRDPHDFNKRHILNLGHTYGHAIEWYQSLNKTKNAYSHGQAVAIGLVRAAELSEHFGYAKKGLADALRTDFKACGLPTELPCDSSKLAPAFINDKKADQHTLHFVFIREIGKVEIHSKDISDIL